MLPGNALEAVMVDPFEEVQPNGVCGESGGSRGAEDMEVEPEPSKATPSSRRWLPKILMLWEVVLGEMFGEGEEGRWKLVASKEPGETWASLSKLHPCRSKLPLVSHISHV